jgi:hypothetical protein
MPPRAVRRGQVGRLEFAVESGRRERRQPGRRPESYDETDRAGFAMPRDTRFQEQRVNFRLILGILFAAALWGQPHRFVATDYTQGKVFIIDARGQVEWSYGAPSANDVWMLPSGNLLFNTGHGVREVTRAKKVVFAYDSASDIYACQRLPNGNTFVGECSAARLLELDPAGKIVKELRLLPTGQSGGSAYMRNARRLANGNYLVAHYGMGGVREYDPAGKVVREIPAPGGPHSAIRLPGGNTLVASADAGGAVPRVFEVDPQGVTVWEVKGDELPGISLKFMAGLERLANGHTVMSNWLGHNHLGQAPHLIEITRAKEVVWTYADHTTFKTVSSVQLLDVKGESWH